MSSPSHAYTSAATTVQENRERSPKNLIRASSSASLGHTSVIPPLQAKLKLQRQIQDVFSTTCTCSKAPRQNTYTLACGFFLEKSQASPRSDILTCPCSSSRIFAGCRETQGGECLVFPSWQLQTLTAQQLKHQYSLEIANCLLLFNINIAGTFQIRIYVLTEHHHQLHRLWNTEYSRREQAGKVWNTKQVIIV